MVDTEKLENSKLEEKTNLKVSDTDEEALHRVLDRMGEMKQGKDRQDQEALWDYVDKTFKAKPSYKWN
jgi:hypothetical protein